MAKTTEIRPKIAVEETITHRYDLVLTEEQLLDVLAGRAEIPDWARPPANADVEFADEGLLITWKTTVTKNRTE